jgi:hypothetical protein
MVKSQPGQRVPRELTRKKLTTKRAGAVTQGVGLEFKPQYLRKKK